MSAANHINCLLRDKYTQLKNIRKLKEQWLTKNINSCRNSILGKCTNGILHQILNNDEKT